MGPSTYKGGIDVSSTITIPAKPLPLLRSGAQIQAGRAAEAFSQASEWLDREQPDTSFRVCVSASQAQS